MPPSARNGAKGTPCLRAAGPRAATIAMPASAPAAKPMNSAGPDRAGRGTGPSRPPASRRPCPCRPGRRSRRPAGSRPRRRRRSGSRAAGSGRRSSTARAPSTAPAAISRLGMMRSSRSVAAAATRITASASAGHSAASRPNLAPEHDEQRRGHRLDQRVAQRDRACRSRGSGRAAAAKRRSGCCRRSGSWSRSRGSASAASRWTRAAEAGRRARSRSCPNAAPQTPEQHQLAVCVASIATRCRRPCSRRCSAGAQVRWIVPVGMRWTLKVDRLGRGRRGLDLELVAGRDRDREVVGVLERGLLLLELRAGSRRRRSCAPRSRTPSRFGRSARGPSRPRRAPCSAGSRTPRSRSRQGSR